MWAVLHRRTQNCQQILPGAVTSGNVCCTLGPPSLGMLTADAGTWSFSFCRWAGLKTGTKTRVAAQIAAMHVAGSLEPPSHGHVLSLCLPLFFLFSVLLFTLLRVWLPLTKLVCAIFFFFYKHVDSIGKKAYIWAMPGRPIRTSCYTCSVQVSGHDQHVAKKSYDQEM